MGEIDLFCLANNRKGDPDSMGPLDFYNLLFVGSNRLIKRRFDYSLLKYHQGTVTRKSAKFCIVVPAGGVSIPVSAVTQAEAVLPETE